MMYQGLYGVFPFTVSDAEVCTFRDLKTSREQVYAVHNVLNGVPKVQHTGRNLNPVTLTVQVVPLEGFSTVNLRLRALEAMTASGDELPLVIGFRYYGMYVLQQYEVSHHQLHYGVSLAAEVALSLMEYN